MFNLFNLNYACLGTALRFPDNKAPEVLVVEYNDNGKPPQTRMPGGTVTFEDILSSIMKIQKENDENIGLNDLIQNVRLIESSFKESIGNYKERYEKNNFFGRKLQEVTSTMHALLDDGLIQEICYKSREETMTRKLMSETNASEVGELIQMSVYRLGNHEKCGFVSVQVKAPDFYQGSGDGDIWLSHWKPIAEVYQKLFVSKSSNHKNLLQSAIHTAVKNNIHPRVDELKEYWIHTNPI